MMPGRQKVDLQLCMRSVIEFTGGPLPDKTHCAGAKSEGQAAIAGVDNKCSFQIKEKNKDKDKDKEKEPPFIEEIRSQCNHARVEFELVLSEKNKNITKQEGLEKKFKLTTTIGTTNMHLFDSDGKIRKYDTLEDVLKDFFKLRFGFYGKRKEVMLENMKKELLKLKNKVRFILDVISGDIIVNNRKRAELFLELKKKNIDPFSKKKVTADTSPEALWLRDLDALENELDVLDAKFKADEDERRATR